MTVSLPIRAFAVIAPAVVVAMLLAPHAHADAAASTGGASASASIVIKIVIPARLSVDFPAAGEMSTAATRFVLNSGWLSVTSDAGHSSGDYVEWGRIHELELEQPELGGYTVASP